MGENKEKHRKPALTDLFSCELGHARHKRSLGLHASRRTVRSRGRGELKSQLIERFQQRIDIH